LQNTPAHLGRDLAATLGHVPDSATGKIALASLERLRPAIRRSFRRSISRLRRDGASAVRLSEGF
jgi:hypothetical protein